MHMDVRLPPLVPMKMDVADFFRVAMVVMAAVRVIVFMAVMMVMVAVLPLQFPQPHDEAPATE